MKSRAEVGWCGGPAKHGATVTVLVALTAAGPVWLSLVIEQLKLLAEFQRLQIPLKLKLALYLIHVIKQNVYYDYN